MLFYEQPNGATMKVTREVFAGEGEYYSSFLHHFLIECVAKHGKNNPSFIERISKKDEVEVNFIIDGEEVDVTETLEFFWSQMDRMVKERAIKMVSDQFSDIEDSMREIQEGIITTMKNKLGLPDESY